MEKTLDSKFVSKLTACCKHTISTMTHHLENLSQVGCNTHPDILQLRIGVKMYILPHIKTAEPAFSDKDIQFVTRWVWTR